MQSVLLGNHGATSFFEYILFIILAGTVTGELRVVAFSDYHYGGELRVQWDVQQAAHLAPV